MNALIWLVALVVLYYGLITWAVFFRGPFRFVYNPVIAWVLVNFMGRMQCITLGARCYGYATNWQLQLTPARRTHERFHYTYQWRERPFTFVPIYVFLLAKYGYDRHPWEQAARLAAGEPTR